MASCRGGATIKTDEETAIVRDLYIGDEVSEVNVLITSTCSFIQSEVDPYIPCKKRVSISTMMLIGASSQRIRAYARAGLIPSACLQERRILQQRTQRDVSDESLKELSDLIIVDWILFELLKAHVTSNSSTSSCRQPKTKKIMYDLTENDDFVVAKLYPRPGIYRPVVLIGAPGVGRNELRRRLIARDPEKYRSPVPYTTRPMRTGEVAGREYIFVSREKMEADIELGHLYGTSAESVKSIVNAGCVCLLSPHYQAIKALRTVQLKPFLIHIKPPEFDELKKDSH
ncbi:MAGUK p55 subfamily member 5 [Lucilia cuprina]|nr:MAGUK p55 subfamily member 5 [Lucilia cuprina]